MPFFRTLPSVAVYPDYQRIDPFGQIVPPDRQTPRREILSPAIPRNATVSFHLAITAPAKDSYFLYLVPNPLDACGLRLFREHFTPHQGSWIPDRLEEVHRLPEFGTMPDPDQRVPGQTTSVYLLDVSVPRQSALSGFRLEIQLKVGGWVIRPLEVRIPTEIAPDPPPTGPGALADLAAPATATADLVRAEREPAWNGSVATVRDILRRNAVHRRLR